jgi:tRNA(Ile)-lysidine synthase
MAGAAEPGSAEPVRATEPGSSAPPDDSSERSLQLAAEHGRAEGAPHGDAAASRAAAPPDTPEWIVDQRIGALPQGLTRDELVAEVARALTGVPRGAGLLAAISGGPDSTTMAHLLSLARPDLNLELVHIRHGLRDDAADAAVAAAHAAQLEAAYHEEQVEVGGGGSGPEAAARAARYGALLRRAEERGCAWLAIGHTADDQAETVLLNLVRGAGLRGLGGMRPVRAHGRVRIVRPLLRIRRSDVAAFVVGEGLLAVADPTNRDPQQRRARARHEVLPVLERLAGGPGDVIGSLNRLAELARIDTDALDVLASEHAERLVVVWGRTRAVRSELLLMLPRALSTRILRLTAATVGGDLSADAVGRIFALGSGEALHITGSALVSCGGGWLGFAPQGLAPLAREPLIIPGTTPLPQLGLDVHVEWPWPLPPSADPGQLDLGSPAPATVAEAADERPEGPVAGGPPGTGPRTRMWAVFDAAVSAALMRGEDFAVRARRDGDRLRSSVGMRKLQDLLVDAHVPRVCRDLVPVVVDEHDEPLWVPGVAQRVGNDDRSAGIRMWLAPGAEPSRDVSVTAGPDPTGHPQLDRDVPP